MHSQSQKSGKPWGKIASVIATLIGVAVLIILIWRTGFSKFARAITEGGAALLLLTLFYPFQLVTRAWGWKYVFPGVDNAVDETFIIGFWFAQSINLLLPTATIGGAVARTKYLLEKGKEQTDVIVSLIADKTAHGFTTVALLVIGLLLLFTKKVSQELLIIISAISFALTLGLFLFIWLQRSSGVSSILKRWANKDKGLLSMAGKQADVIETKLDKIYGHPGPFVVSIVIRLMGDIAMAGEVWFASWLMNTPITIIDALALRLITYGIRSAAFVVYSGIGIQEIAYASLSTFVGLPAASLIAISLATRIQEVVTAIPGVILLMTREGHRAFHMSQPKPNTE